MSGQNITDDHQTLHTTLVPSISSSLSSTASDNVITDVVAYSLCALCSINLRKLYPENYHETFRDDTIKCLIEHFSLPKKVHKSMREFLNEEFDYADERAFVNTIRKNYDTGYFKIIEELSIFSVKSGTYDARSHYLIIEIARLLGVPKELVEIYGESVFKMLSLEAHQENSDESKAREKRETRKKYKKYFMIGLASIGGGAVIGVTGGLAAPIVASAVAGVIGAGSLAMSTAAVGIVGSLFGVAGAGLTASKMNKRIGDLEEFAFESLSPDADQTSLTITIAVSGWVSDERDQSFSQPWKFLRHTKEQYCIRYESKYLLELSRAMDYLLSFVVSYATQEALKYTFLAGLMAAIAWPTALITMANIIDNPWDVCLRRSAEVGKHLANVLISRQQGKRPVSLIGFSLGARVIFFCLQEMSQRTDCEGIISDVVLLGAPVTASQDQWKAFSRLISGTIINGYCSNDWFLKFLYRTSSAAIKVAGLQEIRWNDRRLKNIDLSPIVQGHMDYYKKLSDVLDYVGVKTVLPSGDDLNSSNDSGIGRTSSNVTDISQQLYFATPKQVRKTKSDLDGEIISLKRKLKSKRNRNKSI